MASNKPVTPRSLPALAPPNGIPEAQPAWELEAESWIFPFWTSNGRITHNKSARAASASSTAADSGSVAQRQGLDAGGYHPRENVGHLIDDQFHGGPGGWILYRYASSPVGPYDELIYVAGIFDSKSTATRGLRITNIYVSTENSVWNGRRNWNIPKHVARFEWSHGYRSGSRDPQSVRVHTTSSEQPFFSATLTPSRYIPSLPVNTNLFIFPSLPLYQPALRAGNYREVAKAQAPEAKASTASLPADVLRATAPTFSGNVTLAYCAPALKSESTKTYGDGVFFPKAQNTLGVGLYFPNVTVSFPWSQEYGATLQTSKSK